MADKKRSKLFLWGLCIFLLCAVAGYIQADIRQPWLQAQSASVPEPQIPDETIRRFAQQFSRVASPSSPDFLPSVSFQGPGGVIQSWDDFKGHYLLINFWATWCAPCVVELPSLQKLKDRYEKHGLNVIAVSIDYNKDLAFLEAFLDNRGIGPVALYHDSEKQLRTNIPMSGIPTSYLLAPDGQVLYVFEGDADWNSPESVAFFNTLLGSSSHL